MATMAGSGKIVRNFFRGETFWFPSIETPSLSFFAKISFISFLPQPSEAAAAAAIAKALNSKSNNTRASVIFLCSNNLSKKFHIWHLRLHNHTLSGLGKGGWKKCWGRESRFVAWLEKLPLDSPMLWNPSKTSAFHCQPFFLPWMGASGCCWPKLIGCFEEWLLGSD